MYRRKGFNPKSLTNLKKFGKGENGGGNPAGRQKAEDVLVSCLKAGLVDRSGNGKTRAQNISDILLDMSEHGDIRAIDLVMSYTCVKPEQGNKLSGEVILRVIRDSSDNRNTN